MSVRDLDRLREASPLFSRSPVEWHVLDGHADYQATVDRMEGVAEAIARDDAAEQVWLLEHPPLLTAGTKARDEDLLDARLPVHRTGRGGEFTYHGPGQRVAYVMLDLSRRRRDVRAFVHALEGWLIDTLAALNVTGERRADRVGVWVQRPARAPNADGSPCEEKVAAIGVRLRRWVTFHGISLNVDPELAHYGSIVPCGISEHGVTSLVDLGLPISMEEVDIRLRRAFEAQFGPTVTRPRTS